MIDFHKPASYLFFIAFLLVNFFCGSLPAGKSGINAETVKNKIQNAMGFEHFKNTSAISFVFKDRHHHFWDRKRGFSEVAWQDSDDQIVTQFNLKNFKGVVYKNKIEIKELQTVKHYIYEANKKFVNDIFWLNPAFQWNSPGAQAEITDTDHLIIRYKSGGVTPGDTYEYEYNGRYFITSMKMWVQILPVKGLTAHFGQYLKTETGFYTALQHQILFLNVSLSEVKTYPDYPQQGEDRFVSLSKLSSKNE